MAQEKQLDFVFEFQNTTLWKTLEGVPIFAVKLSDGTMEYISVMGNSDKMMETHSLCEVLEAALETVKALGNQSVDSHEMENYSKTREMVWVKSTYSNDVAISKLRKHERFCKEKAFGAKGDNKKD